MTNQPVGPALRRRLLAKELVKLREAAGLKPPAVANSMRCDRTQISHYEAGRRLPTYPALVLMLSIYGASDRLEELTEWLDLANQRGWWDLTGLPHLIKMYLGLENDAVRVRYFTQELVPGLVQTESYARALEARHGNADPDPAVKVRLQRQERIGHGLTVEVVMSEGLLWRTLNMGPAGADQLRFLAAEHPGISLSVLEYSSGAHRSMSGGFTLMDFPAGMDPIAYLPYAQGSHLVDDRGVISKLSDLHDELRDAARGIKSSHAMTAVMKEVGKS